MDLSIIIVTWNVKELLRACLNSLPAATEWLSSEVIVVDNASSDGTPDLLAAEFPHVKLIRNGENVGFSRANNQGLAVARGRYTVLLNADTEPRPQALTKTIRFMDSRPAAGAASPRLVRPGGKPQPYAFGGDPSPVYLLRRTIAHTRQRYLHDWDVAKPIAVDWVSGACLVVRREAWEAVGGLDEQIFMYFEDNDWCRRMRLAGWQVWYYPEAEVMHVGGASLNQSPRAQAAYYESLAYFYRRHYGPLAGALMRMAVRWRFS